MEQFFMLSPELLVVANFEGKFVRVNPSWTRVLGYSVEQLEGLPFTDLIAPEDLEATATAMGVLAEGKTVDGFVNRYRHADGSLRWLSWHASPVDSYIYATVRDVTADVKIRERLSERELIYRTLFVSLRQGVVLQSGDGRIREANPAAQEILGLTLDQMQGRTSTDPDWRSVRLDLSDFPGDEHPASLVLATGQPQNNVDMGVFNPRTSTYRWLKIDSQPIEIDDETWACSTFVDVTAEREMELSRKQTRDAVDQHAIVSVTDAQGTILEVNERLCEASGYARDELVGRSHRMINSGRHEPGYFRELWQTIESGETWQGEICNRAKDGSYYWVVATTVPLRDAVGKINGYLSVETDITPQKQAQLVAHDANQSKNRFLTTISHELRTPLTSIMALSELAQDRSHDVILNKELGVIREQGLQLLGLIDHILSFVESDEINSQLITIDIEELLSVVTSHFQRAADMRKIELELSLPETNVTVIADRARLERTLGNLIDNAIKFNRRGGRVEVGARGISSTAGERTEFWVADDGPGIAADQQKLLLEPMTRGDDTDSRSIGGVGLGLATAAQLVTRMGGLLEIDSQPGRGTRVHFALSTNVQPEESETPAVTSGQPVSPQNVLVLVVDDSTVNRMVAQTVLEEAGFVVALAQDGSSAVQMVSERRFDVVLMDIQMPGMDGFEATARIRETFGPTELPIVAVTAHAVPGYRQKCLNAGMNDYLSKPYTIEELVQCVSDIAEVAMSDDAVTPDQDLLDPDVSSMPERKQLVSVDDELAGIVEFVGGLVGRIEDVSRIVRLYAEQLKSAESTLANWLDEPSAVVPPLAVHSLKGSSLSCGADQLAAECVAAETAIAGGVGVIHALTRLLDHVRLLRVAVDGYLQESDGPDAVQEDLPTASAPTMLTDQDRRHLQDLADKLRSSEYISPDDIRAIASDTSAVVRQELPEIEKAVSSLDYQGALRILEALLSQSGSTS